MKPLSALRPATRFANRPWMCPTCRHSQWIPTRQPIRLNARNFASENQSYGRGGRSGSGPRTALLYASAGTAAVAGTALAFTDDIKSGYEAAERTGRVVITLAICINEYGMQNREAGNKS